VEVKDSSVNIWGLKVQMQPVLKNAEKIWESRGKGLVITSARDGIHSAGSLHYYGYAVDLRASEAWGYTPTEITVLVEELHSELGSDYQIIRHDSHIHVEYEKAKEWLS